MHSRSILALFLLTTSLLACSRNPPDRPPKADSSAPGSAQSSTKETASRGNRPQAVQTTRTLLESVPIILEVQGSVVALDEVELRAQKNGTIKEVLVTEGSEIRRGQLLFTLDDRDDQANVQKAAAAVTSAETALSIARRDLARNQDLATQNFISSAALDTYKSKVETAEAALAQNKAALEQALVSRSYTRITAPFDGRAGRVDVRPGALVTASATATALVKITRMHPIGVSFALPERDLPNLLAAQKAAPVKITAVVDGKNELPGQVSFIDSSVDRSAGTIAVKAKLDNAARKVWPGQYVNVRVVAGTVDNAVVLPAQAVLNTPNGRVVYVVSKDATVHAQPVEIVRIFEQKAIVKGIEAGVKVVIEGGQNLRPGAQVSEAREGERKGKGDAGRDSGRAAQSEPTTGKPGNASSPAEGATKTASPQASAKDSAIRIPEGFTPRDPERWAAASDEEKRLIIERWRERRAAAGAGAQ